LRIIVSQNVVHENISLNIVVKVRNYNRPNWRWMFKECGGYIEGGELGRASQVGLLLMLPAKPKSLLVMKMDVVWHWRI
jgi:hypothetical protein